MTVKELRLLVEIYGDITIGQLGLILNEKDPNIVLFPEELM